MGGNKIHNTNKKENWKSKQSNYIIGKDMTRHFTEEDMPTANKYMQKSTLSLAIREI